MLSIFRRVPQSTESGLLVLNLLSAHAGGHVTRANNFLKRVRSHLPDVVIIVFKPKNLLLELDLQDQRIQEFNVRLNKGFLSKIFRVMFENLVLPLILMNRACVLLTFSHYLPRWLPSSVRTIVGVTNLAPFSTLAQSEEPLLFNKLRLSILKHSILKACMRADNVIAISRFCMETLVKEGIQGGKIAVVPNGVSEEFFQRKNDKSPWHKKYFLCVSNFYSYKNFINLIDAYSLLPKKIQTEFDLLLIGWPIDSDYLARVEDKIKAHKLVEKIKILSTIQHGELSAYYQNSSVFVFPSLVENCPNILLEALASGVCAVSSNIEPMPEFGGDAVTYFNPLSPEDMAKKILFQLQKNVPFSGAPKSIARAKFFPWDEFTKQVSMICINNFQH